MQISREAGQVVWHSHLVQNFPQFIVIHTVKGFGIVNKAEVDRQEIPQSFLKLTSLRNLYAGQEATVRIGHGTTDWFQIGKGVCQGCI